MNQVGFSQDNQVDITPTTSTKEHTRRFSKKHVIILVVISVLLIIICGSVIATVLKKESSDSSTNKLAEHPVILVSFDGFRNDYLTRGLTPNFNNFGKAGVQAKFLMSQFPTKTFPNHYSIVTGLFPESHGIVFNNFYDPKLKKKFTIRNSKPPAFWGGEPIWMTAKKVGMKTASYFWVGSEIEGLHPTYYKDFNRSVPASVRINQIIHWLQLPKEDRPSFITLYFSQPDYTGHRFGTDSKELNKQLQVVDGIFGDLLVAIDKINMTNSINLIVVSDHGMSNINCRDNIFLDKYGILESKLYWNNLGAIGSFSMKKIGDNQGSLRMVKCVNDSFRAFHKKNLPKRMHFSNNRRIDQIIVLPDQGKTISIDSSRVQRWCSKGEHGYDNISPSMRSIFMARGPSFEKNKIVEHFSNIEIYNLLAGLLGIMPASNNGTVGSLNKLLSSNSKQKLPQLTTDGNSSQTDICQFPTNEIFKARSKCCNCSGCVGNGEANAVAMNKVFNLSSKEEKNYKEFHLPWGIPDGGAGVEVCLMIQPNFIIGYNTQLRIALWSANRGNGTVSYSQSGGCVGYDVRLKKNESGNCSSYPGSGFVQGVLGQSGSLGNNTNDKSLWLTIAMVVPQYPNFNEEIWIKLEMLVKNWSSKYKNVYVISGSIFDTDENGLKDDDELKKKRLYDNPDNSVIPTHFYKIVTRCTSPLKGEYLVSGCDGSFEVISFILRNTDEWCMFHDWQKTLLLNVARVKDIELLTGINFFPKLSSQLQAEIKTFLPVELWP